VTAPRAFKFAVLGSSGATEESERGRRAFAVGRAVAARGGILLTGGCTGLPHAAVQGAASLSGFTLAVSPASNEEEHVSMYGYPTDSSAIVCTGMGTKGRNVILVRSADACLFLGGGMGTLNEFTIAFSELGPKCAIGILKGTGGFSDEYTGLASKSGQIAAALLFEESDPDALVERAWRHLIA
jgi:uncharacterized protein (TIGR00725 family)